MMFDKCVMPWCVKLADQPGYPCPECQAVIDATMAGPVRETPLIRSNGAICLCGCPQCRFVSGHCLSHRTGCHLFFYRDCKWRPGQPTCSPAVEEENRAQAEAARNADREAARFWGYEPSSVISRPSAKPRAATAGGSLAGCQLNATAVGPLPAQSSARPARSGLKAASS
jgi:hypothetical protein